MSELPPRRVLLSTDEMCRIVRGYVQQLYGGAPGAWEAIVDANGTRITINWTNTDPRAEGSDESTPKGALRLVKSEP